MKIPSSSPSPGEEQAEKPALQMLLYRYVLILAKLFWMCWALKFSKTRYLLVTQDGSVWVQLAQ